MAGRPPKEGLDYSDWDVALFDDPKIDRLIDSMGCNGFAIFFYLCQRGYGTYGYYLPWRDQDAATVARKVGGGVKSAEVTDTVAECLCNGLFDVDVYTKHKVLTSRAMQKRFVRVLSVRRVRNVIAEYWLLPPEKSGGAICLPNN